MQCPCLLYALLAYSASHRAALLRLETPVNAYVKSATQILNRTYSERDLRCSISIVAAILLLVSMGSAFNALSVTSCQAYLGSAASILVRTRSQVDRDDETILFLIHWYLMLHCFKGSPNIKAHKSLLSTLGAADACLRGQSSDPLRKWVECVWGITAAGMQRLIEVAKIVQRACRNDSLVSDHGTSSWPLPPDIPHRVVNMGWGIIGLENLDHVDLERMRGCESKHCPCFLLKIELIGRAYHCASLIHLQRRISGLPISELRVQQCVKNILEYIDLCDYHHPLSSVLLFPLITAGAAAQRHCDRDIVLKYCEVFQSMGFSHVRFFHTLLL